MGDLRVLCILLWMCHVTVEVSHSEGSTPPLIIEEPPKLNFFKDGGYTELACIASGTPDPQYSWQKDGEDFDPSETDGRVYIGHGKGTLVFNKTIESDVGVYQCYADNGLGIAITILASLEVAFLQPFPNAPPQIHEPMLGAKLVLRCEKPASYPTPEISWSVIQENGTLQSISLSERVTIDPEGNLLFSNVLLSDALDGRMYTCVVHNKVMGKYEHGSYAVISPRGVDSRNPPKGLWVSPHYHVALLGETWRVSCIFSGMPTPSVNWTRQDQEMPNRTKVENFGRELVIENVQFSDAGKYECLAINDVATVPVRYSFDLEVEAAPYWMKRPESMEVYEGLPAEFHCEAGGIPSPMVSWYFNGIPSSKAELPPHWILDQYKITALWTVREDTMVIQCLVMNKHGSSLANAYLNVISDAVVMPPEITEEPPKLTSFIDGAYTELACLASGMPDPKYSWQKDCEDFDPSDTDGRVYMRDGKGTLVFNNTVASDEGIYQCHADNGFGKASTLLARLELFFSKQFPEVLPHTHYPMLGAPLTLFCRRPPSYPKPKISWSTIQENGIPQPVSLSERVAIDPEGNLMLSNVQHSDALDGRMYFCVTHNEVLKKSEHGSYAQISPRGEEEQNHPVELMWVSQVSSIALLGETWRIKCIFSGMPTPSVSWTRRGQEMPNRTRVEDFGRELVIENIQFSDAGKYECAGTNDYTTIPVKYLFYLEVEAAPYWGKRPENVEVHEGETAEFHCRGGGIPEPLVLWYLNGKRLSQVYHPHLKSEQKITLTTKDDRAVIKCKVTNKHGSIFSKAYLNVLPSSVKPRDGPYKD